MRIEFNRWLTRSKRGCSIQNMTAESGPFTSPAEPRHLSPAGILPGIFNHAADAVFAVDPRGRIVYWNGACEALLGYSSREVEGTACCRLLGGIDSARAAVCGPRCRVSRLARENGAVPDFDISFLKKDGERVWVNAGAMRVGNGFGDGAVVHILRPIVVEHLMTRLGHLSQGTVREPTLDKRQNLTRRELQILRLMADGRGTRGSAEDLSISAATVRNHVKSIFSKLGVHSRAEAVGHALRNKLI